MVPTLRFPTERTCERCGRTEVWADDVGSWRLATDDADSARAVGSPYCIHEWDINGTFVPFEREGLEA
ncbi:HEWD family protein [Halobellus captivus]|uniref:HEWD family protein n=1 Tax=Halobellus captivus TaxID=2592614 RepID=UPI00119E3F5C|nr:HEWD family protein [Halobellus captivus]